MSMSGLDDALMTLGAILAATVPALGGLWGATPERLVLQGYVEGEPVRLGPAIAGTLDTVAVARGTLVAVGTPLFTFDPLRERAARDEAAARLQQAQAQLGNLRTGKRPPEVAVVAAQKLQAEAALRLSEAQGRRQEILAAEGASPPGRLDEARAAYARDRARVAELTAQLEAAQLAARADEIGAAEAAVEAARAALSQAEWRVAQLATVAPVAAVVEDTYYRPGEYVAAGAPVVSLLPPDNVKLRFYVPETRLGALALGQSVDFRCDACPSGLTARITFIAPRAEYTPPVIYSVGSREKLVFRVEARPDGDPGRLHPGQPVDVAMPPP